MPGCEENKARLGRMLHILAQSKTARMLFSKLEGQNCRLHMEGVMTSFMGAGGFHHPDNRLIVITPLFSDEMGASIIAHEMVHALQHVRGILPYSQNKGEMHPLAIIQQDVAADADARALSLQMAWELKDVAPRVWQIAARQDPAMTDPFMAALKADPEAANDGRAALAALMGFIKGGSCRGAYEKAGVRRVVGPLIQPHLDRMKSRKNMTWRQTKKAVVKILPFLLKGPEEWPETKVPDHFFTRMTDWNALEAGMGINEILAPQHRQALKLDTPELRGIGFRAAVDIGIIGYRYKNDSLGDTPHYSSGNQSETTLKELGEDLGKLGIFYTRLAKHILATPKRTLVENITLSFSKKTQQPAPQPTGP